VPAIRAALQGLPGVEVIDVVGSDEMWPLIGPEEIRADLKVGNGGRLLLCDVTSESIKGNRPFMIARVANWTPIVNTSRDEGRMRFVAGCFDSVDVGRDSAFLELVPFPLQSVSDVVFNYDRLNGLVESWPETPKRIPAKNGTDWIEFHKQPFREHRVRPGG